MVGFRELPDFPPAPKLNIYRRLLTLEDMVEFFKLIQRLNLNQQEKSDIVAFLRVL